MVAAIAAGNTCILKPSEIAFHSSAAMAKLINENFPSNYLYVAEGGVEETTKLLKLKFDKIFFTGSTTVGKIVYEGGCINETVMHLGNDNLPFGGVGHSGMGHYHGKFGFDAFSYQKSVFNKKTWGEPDLKYPPCTERKMKWIGKLM